METYDVAIAGLGAMGSAAAFQLARRGQRVLGLDRFHPPHELGSSHGKSRIIREAYFEDPRYVPIVQRAAELWRDLEARSGRKLLLVTGGVMIGPGSGPLVRGAERSARAHRLAYERLPGSEVRRRFPALRAPDDAVAIWEPHAGVLFPEACIAAHLECAAAAGADLHFEEPILEWNVRGEDVGLRTATAEYAARRLVLAAGAWGGGLARITLPLMVERQVLYWFEAASDPESLVAARCPVFVWEHAPQRYFYGLPDVGDGLKVARHHEGESTTADTVRRTVSPAEVDDMRTLVARCLPNANGALLAATVCLYTNTPDTHFLIDFHPAHPRVLIVSPCSGHGFKFSSAIGEIVADLCTSGRSRFDLSLFGVKRLIGERV